VSGYNDRVVLLNFRHIRNDVIQLQQKKHNDSNYDMTAFLEYLLEMELTMDEHFYPMTGLCDPCNIEYDKVVKLETQTQDLSDVVPHLGPYFHMNNVHANQQGNGAASQFVWSVTDFKNVDSEMMRKVMRLGFDIDMELFGYSFDRNASSPSMQLKCAYDDMKCC